MALKEINVEISGTVFSLPHLVAKELGFFEEEGLDVTLVKRDREGAPTQNAIRLVEDHRQVTSFGGHSPFEAGETALYRACEWGQVRRAQDSAVGGQVAAKRAGRLSQAIIVRPDSPISTPYDLADVPVGVNFHHGSHYVTLQLLEGFLPREEIKIVHLDGGNRFTAVRDGLVEAATVMEPWITVADKLGYKIIAEGHYVGLEISSPTVNPEIFDGIHRAIRKAAKLLRENPYPYVKYLIADVDESIVKLEPSDFSKNRLRYDDPAPYLPRDFERTYNWLVSWGLVQPDDSYDHLVDNKIAVNA